MSSSFRPWLMIPPEWAHEWGPTFLRMYSVINGSSTPLYKSLFWRGLLFKNPIGIAGGLDKDAESVEDWFRLGCGFVEIGTVTPRPQGPNPGKIMDRHIPTQSLWNKMGFPSLGAKEVACNLRALDRRAGPLFVNLGKNRDTENNQAHVDYISVMNDLAEYADAFVVNISSPNTQGLRDLQKKENLQRLLDPVMSRASQLKKPLLLKLSPDMDPEGLQEAIHNSCDLGVDGWTLTNTTLARLEEQNFPKEGGMSGLPLAARSKATLSQAIQSLGEKRKGKLIISVGGISSAEDVAERLQMGADLVQIYTGLVYNGPGLIKQILRKAIEQENEQRGNRQSSKK